MTNAISLFSNLPSKYVGFNSFFSDVENFLTNTKWHRAGYPAYDVVKIDSGYTIEVALAGFTKEDLKITFNTGNRMLSIVGRKTTKDEKEKTYSSIASRQFMKQFTLERNLSVDKVSLNNGMLSIELKQEATPDTEVEFDIQ